MKAVILAGGKGRRLAPYTTVLPKPLMPIGDVPILEVVVRQLRHAGFDEITMAVGYLAELLMVYFGDGSKFGVHIHYSREEHPLGTAGPLSLVKGLDEPFLMMNGDLLTTLNYRAMWEQHRLNGAIATLATYQRNVKIDLGVVETDDEHWVRGYTEKPIYHYTVSTGVYVFNPAVLQYIPIQTRMDLPELVLKLLADGHRIAAYPLEGYWLDIGRHDDYERAIFEFEHHRAEFLPME
jgi:NDP-sugar pyrophosphorylase family protein